MGAIKKRNVTKIQSTYTQQQEMHEISASRKKKLLFRRLTVFLIFAVVISYFMITTLISQSATLDTINAEKAELDRELKDLKRTEMLLKEEIVKLNDDEYIAKLARKDYFLSDEDEIIFTIPQEDSGNTSQ
ncbi:FtsB family cell division protein [Bacillus dakarensis]|uniref:FtsB family cell division protein n=1 Tax=Robertmurraya dakarensis TaxID=1926278 RepID=UPI000981CD83|nr:septum formation initiator family protein [Bacillus dakarensis]